MRCINCGTDNRYKERAGGRCKQCGRPFAFEPQRMKDFPLTDRAFQAAIEAVSERDTLYFTPRQLYYQVLRAQQARPRRRGGAGLVLFWVLGFLVFLTLGPFTEFLPLPVALLAGAAFVAVGYALRRAAARATGQSRPTAPAAALDYASFKRELLGRWVAAHGEPPTMLPEGGRPRPAPSSGRRGKRASDLRSFSFDRLLVCDRAETADLLLANNLHFEVNTPVVSVDGHPSDVFDEVMAMARQNPNLTVFALHDADPEGCLLPLRLREDPAWFPQPTVTILDIGLRPRQVPGLAGQLIVQPAAGQVTLPPALHRLLSPGERDWLARGHRAELAALRPARLLQTIYRALNQAAGASEAQRRAAATDPRGFFQTQLPGVQPVRSAGAANTRESATVADPAGQSPAATARQ